MKTTFHCFAASALGTALTVLLSAAEPSAAPAASGYVPCKIIEKTTAIYPTRMLHEGIVRGEARLVIEVDPNGRLTDSLVTAYSRVAFADEAVRTVAHWRFAPGTVDGKPITSIIWVTFNFETGGVVAYERHIGVPPEKVWFDDSFAYFPHGLNSLDQKPELLHVSAPIYPKAWMDEGRTGAVTVSFFIDEQGRARMPAVLSSTDDMLAGSAIAAVKEWRFLPPLHRGQPVLVQAEQVFVFQPGKKPPSTS
jgi:TonB family protein